MDNEISCRIFLLSPAYAAGERARMILSERAQFELARRLRNKQGATIAEVFTFLSGLYFRGKIAYANAFARPIRGTSGVFVITPTRGLIEAHARIRLNDLREFALVDIHESDPRYREPLERDARRLVKKIPPRSEIILLGSIATGKYVDVLLSRWRARLLTESDRPNSRLEDTRKNALKTTVAADGSALGGRGSGRQWLAIRAEMGRVSLHRLSR